MGRSLQVEMRLCFLFLGTYFLLLFELLSGKEMEDVWLFPCIVFMGEFQKIVWTEKEKLWTWMKKNGSPEERKNEIQRFTTACGKKSTYVSHSPHVQVKQAFLCCYPCSDFCLAGQLSGLGCGEFLLILALLWLQWTVSTARETKFHSLQISQGWPCEVTAVCPEGGGPLSSRGPGPIDSWKKKLQKTFSKTPMSLKPGRIPNPLAYGSPGLFLLSYLTSIQGKQKTTVWLSKTIYSHENLWRVTALDE